MSEAHLIVSIAIDEYNQPNIYKVDIYSEGADCLTRIGKKETLACIFKTYGKDYSEARRRVIERIAYDLAMLGQSSEYIWVVPLMEGSDIEQINDEIDNIKLEGSELYIKYELENKNGEEKPR